MNEVQKGTEQAEVKTGKKKYFRVHDRINHLVGVVVFYAVVFIIISVISEGLKFFSDPDPAQASDEISRMH